MDKITIGQAQKLSSPNPFALISYLGDDGKTNLTAISWWNYCCNRPPMVTVSMSQKGFGNRRVKQTGIFTLQIVDETLREKAFSCGTISGQKCDKPKEFSIEMAENSGGCPERVLAAVAVMNCKVKQIVPVGDHDLFIADVEEIWGNPERKAVFAMNGYAYLEKV